MSEQTKKDARNLWLPMGTVIVILGSVFFVGAAWASLSGEVNKLKSDVTELKSAMMQIPEIAKSLSRLEVKVDISTASTEKLSNKVDRIAERVTD
jgi:outer membrane murein-binding lipoprotein Lpp